MRVPMAWFWICHLPSARTSRSRWAGPGRRWTYYTFALIYIGAVIVTVAMTYEIPAGTTFAYMVAPPTAIYDAG